MTDKEATAIVLRAERRTWFEYALADEIFYYLERTYQQLRSDRMDNLLIYGETNSGKTQIVKHFIKTIKRNKTEGVRGRDIVFIGAPDKATEGRLWDSVLKAMKVPYKSSETPATKRDSAYSCLEERRYKILIFDDISNYIASAEGLQRLLLVTFRNLTRDLKIAIVATGTPEAKTVLAHDSQMCNRFLFKEVKPWVYDKNYLSIIKSFEEYYAFPKASNLVQFGQSIYDIASGSLGNTRNILKQSALLAIRDRSDSILEKHVNEAVEALYGTKVTVGS